MRFRSKTSDPEVGGAGKPPHLYDSDAAGAIFVFLRYRLTL